MENYTKSMESACTLTKWKCLSALAQHIDTIPKYSIL